MIRVLTGWAQIGEAVLLLQRHGLPLHETPQKNWDQALVYEAVKELDRNAAIVDLGCGKGFALRLLHAMGFRNCVGVDLDIPVALRARQLLYAWRSRTPHCGIKLRTEDICKTAMASGEFTAVLSLSTIEHGVNPGLFFQEASRLLKPGGFLLVTTDYWECDISVDGRARFFGQPWKVFSRAQIEELISVADSNGLRLTGDCLIPGCNERPVLWNGYEYSFIALRFRKGLDAGMQL